MTDKNWDRILDKHDRRTKAARKRRAVVETHEPDEDELTQLEKRYGNIRINY